MGGRQLARLQAEAGGEQERHGIVSAGAGEHIRGTAVHGFALDFAIGRDNDALIRFLAAVLGFAIKTNGAELGGGAGGIAIVNGVSGERGIDLKGESKAAAVEGGFAELGGRWAT